MWLGRSMPPAPMRRAEVAAARWATTISGAEMPMLGVAWCSAAQ
nr:hypothetical protein [Candidatus Frankia alpina]